MHPEASGLCRTRREEIAGKTVVVASVLEGLNPPYFVTLAKGNGTSRFCFMRHGTSNCEANDEELKSLYRKADPTPDELRASLAQNLTFTTLANFFAAAGIAFSESKYQALGLTTPSGFFTNLGFWVSDQSTVQTRVGFFSGTDKASSAGGILTFEGCIVDQYNRIRRLLNNRFGFSHEIGAFDLRRDGTRNEVNAYPEAAVREALVNLFAHRDYSISAPSTITCFADRIELLSFGGLLPEADPALLRLGASMPRNPKLAALLMSLFDMEKYDIDIPLMYSAYRSYGLEPALVEFPRALMIVLPKITPQQEHLNAMEKQVLEFLREHGPTKRADIQARLKRSYGSTISILKSMTEKGAILKEGNGRLTRYRIR